MDPIVITATPTHGAHAREQMKFEYDFPRIENISDVLPAIKDRPEFIVAEKEGYTVLNYNVNFEDTFPPVRVTGGSAKMREERALHNALRRECRGIIFDSKTGAIIRRPYHKFFNVNERDETLERNVNLSASHEIMEKLDGSMIAPFIVDGQMIWGTKMGATDVAKPVEEFVKNNPEYVMFVGPYLDHGFTPIFEWCSNKQRIVLDQPEDMLVLTAIRNMRDGSYFSHSKLLDSVVDFEIPVVGVLKSSDGSMADFVKYVHDLEDLEGYVVRFQSGHMVKLKCHWYIQIHKAKEAILQDRNIVQIILEEKLDDIKANVTQEERDRLAVFETEINKAIIEIADVVYAYLMSMQKRGIDRKEFAINHTGDVHKMLLPVVFRNFDEPTEQGVMHSIRELVRNHLGKNVKYDELREACWPGVKYNDN